jgi:monooxygenase
VQLTSGGHLDADVIVCATGLTLQMAGGAAFEMDGEPIEVANRFMYRGHMLSGVPNAAMVLGYTNASWTLRADLTWQAVCRLLNHMRDHGYTAATPTYEGPPEGAGSVMGLSSGYVQRSSHLLPKQGLDRPWLVRQNFLLDSRDARTGTVTEAMAFERRDPATGASGPPVVEHGDPVVDAPEPVDEVAEEAVTASS